MEEKERLGSVVVVREAEHDGRAALARDERAEIPPRLLDLRDVLRVHRRRCCVRGHRRRSMYGFSLRLCWLGQRSSGLVQGMEAGCGFVVGAGKERGRTEEWNGVEAWRKHGISPDESNILVKSG